MKNAGGFLFKFLYFGTFLFLGAGCAPASVQTAEDNEVTRSSIETPSTLAKVECQFVGPDVLSARMKGLLQIPAGDVPVLSDTGAPTSTMRLASSRATLGQGDLSIGRSDDYSCGTTKYKAAIEIMVDACVISLQDPAVRAKLFPSGLSNFDELYRSFVGRKPSDYEAQVLNDLVAAVSSSKAEAAVCGAVASSFESLIKI